jgi:hypothetical protein
MLEAIKLWGYRDIITAPIAPDAAAFLSRRIGYNPSLVPVDYQHFLGDRESRLRSLNNGQKRAVLGLHDIFNTGLAGHRVFSHSAGYSAGNNSTQHGQPIAAPLAKRRSRTTSASGTDADPKSRLRTANVYRSRTDNYAAHCPIYLPDRSDGVAIG